MNLNSREYLTALSVSDHVFATDKQWKDAQDSLSQVRSWCVNHPNEWMSYPYAFRNDLELSIHQQRVNNGHIEAMRLPGMGEKNRKPIGQWVFAYQTVGDGKSLQVKYVPDRELVSTVQ